MELEDTTSNDTGIIYKGANSFIHNFHHPVGGGAIPEGQNTFIGIDAGNFAMGSTATQGAHASYNTAIGYKSLYSNTIGYYNVANGTESLYSNTTGFENTASGYRTLYSNTIGFDNVAYGFQALTTNVSGQYNTAIGYESLYSNTGSYNTAIGEEALLLNSIAQYNSAIGNRALRGNTTGEYNSALGMNAGRYIANGATANTTGDYNVFLGYDTRALADNDQNEIVIGYNAIGIGSNSAVLGNDSIVTTVLKGNVGISTTSPWEKLTVNGDMVISDDSPRFTQRVNTDNTAFTWHANADGANDPWGLYQLWRGTDDGVTGFSVNPNIPLLHFDDDNNLNFNYDIYSGTGKIIYGIADNILSTTTGIDAKVATTTNLYTVPTGKTAIITGAIIRITTADTISVPPTLGIGIVAGEESIFASTSLVGLDAGNEIYKFTSSGTLVSGAATEVIKLGIDTGATATTMTVAIDLIGYLL